MLLAVFCHEFVLYHTYFHYGNTVQIPHRHYISRTLWKRAIIPARSHVFFSNLNENKPAMSTIVLSY